jgi:hypothetical protein
LSFSRKRRLFTVLSVVVSVAVLALAVIAVSRSSKVEEQPEDAASFEKLLENPKKMTPKEREDLKGQWNNLSPESQRKIGIATIRRGIDKFRKETANLDQGERLDRIRKETLRLRQDREKSIASAKDVLSGSNPENLMKDAMAVYQKDFSAQERAELDPLVHEYIFQLNEVFK